MDVTTISTSELATIVADASAELARRAGGVSAAVPMRNALFDGFAPIDPETVDRDERLADGSRRWRAPKEMQAILRLDADSIIRRINRDHIGVQIGGRYYVDVTRIKGRQ